MFFLEILSYWKSMLFLSIPIGENIMNYIILHNIEFLHCSIGGQLEAIFDHKYYVNIMLQPMGYVINNNYTFVTLVVGTAPRLYSNTSRC